MTHESWGRFIPSQPARVEEVAWTTAVPRFDDLVLPYGRGRTYGDVCLNNGHTLLDVSRMSRLIAFDETRGILTCEAGATLEEILTVVVPRGWFVPVTPGTKFVTVGGCIANDVHGKNHHRAGTFGRHVLSFELLRSDGSRVRCTPADPLFRASIGGLGLTGLITTVELQLRAIPSAQMLVELIPFRTLGAFEELSTASDASHDYTVAWLDTFRDRGIFIRGNHEAVREKSRTVVESYSRTGGSSGASSKTVRLYDSTTNAPRRSIPLPLAPLSPLLNRATMRAFNMAYFHATAKPRPHVTHYDPFFYPLDAVANWNAVYGRRGFLQYQFVIPESAGMAPVAEILAILRTTGLGSSLAVIKKFGALPSPGMLSFPRAGTTVSLDFAGRESKRVLPALERCDDVVEAAGGSVYPAKDARMSAARFRRFFPRWEELRMHADPHFSSSFWRRVTS